jgi:hypothetical protein
MALTHYGKPHITALHGGQSGAFLVRGAFVWDGTDATGTLPFQFGKISGVSFTPLALCDGDEIHYLVAADVNTESGLVAVPATGIAIARTGASPVADLPVSYSYVGY